MAETLLSTATSSLDVALHPLVLVHIADHYTRAKVKASRSEPGQPVAGALLGIQSGRRIEIFNGFELLMSEEEGETRVDTEYLSGKLEQFKKVFPTYEFVGWYCTGSQPTQNDLAAHRQLMTMNDSPLLLKLDPDTVPDTPLAVQLYETIVEMANQQPALLFVKVRYRVETGEAERIALDHITTTAMQTQDMHSTHSQVTSHLSSQSSAIQMLFKRIKIIVEFCKAVDRGELPLDKAILQDTSSLCNRLPVVDGPGFKQQLMAEYNDGLLMMYLAALTKGCSTVNELVAKTAMVHSDRGREPRML